MRVIRALLLVCAGTASVFGAPLALAQTYPAKLVRMIVPSSPGGGSDITARIIGPRLGEHLRQRLVIDNRPGAGTILGTEIAARAAPDGYTLLLASTPIGINPAMYKKIPYNALRDFAPVTQLVSMPNLLVVHPSLPVRTVKELIALARSRPEQIAFASAGMGTSPHLAMELFLSMTRLKMVHVPHKGAGPAIVDVMAGHVSLMTPSIITVLEHVRSGRMRGVAVTSTKRASVAPEFPTISEAGVAGYEATQWFGVLAPAGTPPDVVRTVHSALLVVLQHPEVRSQLVAGGADPVGSTPEAFASFLRAETEKWGTVVKQAGIPAEQ